MMDVEEEETRECSDRKRRGGILQMADRVKNYFVSYLEVYF